MSLYRPNIMRNQIVIAFVVGLIFSLGLAVSGMTRPQNIIAFLDVQHWSPALALVMAGAVTVFSIGMRLALRRSQPITGGRFEFPGRREIDLRLVAGAVMFGVGWGVGGFCPGPALASLAVGNSEVIVFVATMFAGMIACQKLVSD